MEESHGSRCQREVVSSSALPKRETNEDVNEKLKVLNVEEN
jgi:hypothetical protein